jgi:CheY-like chemotaxis protein
MSAEQTILIIANPYDAAVLRRAAHDAGLRAHVAESTELGQQLEAQRPAAVLLDYGLSSRRSAEALAELRQAEQEPLPVVLLASQREGPQTLAEALHFGADHLLLRPIVPELVSSKLSAIIARSAGPLTPDPSESHEHDALAELDESDSVGDLDDLAGVAGPGTTGPLPAAPARRRRPSAIDLSALVDDDGVDEQALLAGHGDLVDMLVTLPTRGLLPAVTFPALLRVLHGRAFSGCLTVRRDGIDKTVIFDDGYPVFARSSAAHDRLGELLLREGRIDDEQLAALMEERRESRRRLGALLVEHGVVKQDELFPLVRRHVLEILFSIFSWTSGEFELEAGEVDDERIRLDQHPAALIVEGIRRKVGYEEVQQRVGGPQTRVRLREGAESRLGHAELDPEEAELARLLSGEQTIGGLASLEICDELRCYQLVYALQVLGLAVVRGEGVQVPYGELAARRQLELSIDGRRIAAKLAQVAEGDYFGILGLRSDASRREVVQAYRRLREELDPGRLASRVVAEHGDALTTIREVLDEAYAVLSSEQLRQAYRRAIAE